MNKNLTFSAPIEAADTERRIIAGQIVPWGEVGNTSVGKVIFERGSIKVPTVSKVKLLAQHEQTAQGVIGRAQSISENDNGMYATFKVSASKDGENYLIKCAENLLDGLSVGCEVIKASEAKDGTLIVSQAILKEVSVVESPAFDRARIDRVAAQEGEDDAAEKVIEEIEDEQIAKISEAVKVLEEVQKIEKALEDNETETESGAEVDNTTNTETGVDAAAASEAPRPTVKAATPVFTATPRHGITSAGRYVEHKIKAAMGNEQSKEWIAASEDPANYVTAATDSIGTTNPAFSPIQYLNNFVSNTNFGRSTIDAVSKAALPASGMQINIPSLVTANGGGSDVAPTVAETGEDVAPSSTGMTSSYESVSVKKFAGSQVITLELIERSDPVFFDQLAIQLQRAMAKAQDEYMVAELVNGGTASGSVEIDSALKFQAFIASQTAEAYAGSSYFAQNLVISPTIWSAIQSFADSTNRPMYTMASPQFNAGGQIVPTSIKGSALGLDVYVDRYVTGTFADDESQFVIAPETAMWWESPSSYFSVNHVADATGNMALQTAIYSYGAAKVLIPAGVRVYTIGA